MILEIILYDCKVLHIIFLQVTLVFWNPKAKLVTYKLDDIMAVKGGKIYEFNGNKFISIVHNTITKVNC